MRAIVYEKYGPPEVLQLREVEQPVPKDDEVLIRIRAVTVNLGDCEMRRPEIPNSIWFLVRLFFGLRRPRKNILGAYFSGDVEAVGKEVTGWELGEPVFAASGARFGAYAEYICLPSQATIVRKPSKLSYEEAAGVTLGGMNALHYLRLADIREGDEVLVNGAAGSFGVFAVQIARQSGAIVTAVDHGDKLDLLRSLGADHVVDYTKEDFSKLGRSFDVIFDVVVKSSYSKMIRSLKDGGRYLLTNPDGFSQLFRAWWTNRVSRKRVITRFAKETVEELEFLRDLCESGKLRSVIDRCYPLEEAVAAHHYVESGKKLGNVVMTLSAPGDSSSSGNS